jgi:hypothetical protein
MVDSKKFALKIFKKEEIKELINVSSLRHKYKIVVFVPESKIDEITIAMSEKGAGVIGNYTVCSFRIKGTGTFKGGKNANPAVGRKEKLETTDEIRLEMVCDKDILFDVIENMLKHHPYEEPAYEIYGIITGSKFNGAVNVILRKPMGLEEIIKRINSKLNIEGFVSNTKTRIKNVIVDMTDYWDITGYITSDKEKTLYINKKTKGEINLMLK